FVGHRRPLGSTRLPYTTLFRSPLQFVQNGAEQHRARRAERMAERDRAAIHIDLLVAEVEGLEIAQHDRGEGLVDLDEIDVVELQDRKSTRLNSSHVKISYAVFC